jgi:hypothetical protein
MDRVMIHSVILDSVGEHIHFSSRAGAFDFGFSYSGKIFEKLDIPTEDGEMYIFKRDTDTMFYNGNDITISEFRGLYSIRISDTGSFYLDSPITEDAIDDFKRIIDNIIKEQVKATGRQLTTLRELPLPENTLSVIGSHLTGNNGSLEGQINKQKQKLGISLAPKARKGKKTRKGRKV